MRVFTVGKNQQLFQNTVYVYRLEVSSLDMTLSLISSSGI